jgi:hypothetical protein
VLAPDSVGSVDERTWEGYKSAADAVVAQVMADPAAKARVIPCTTQDAACIGQVIDQFGQLVFRRPVAAPEKDRFLAMFNQGAEITENGSFDEIAALILKSFLISPSFLTRAETAQTADSINAANFVLSSYEVASRLSYMLWDSMPDAELFTAAASDALKTPAQILTQAERMLTNPKARAKVAAFHDQYLHIGGGTRWAEVERDANKYPLFTQAMVPMLAQSTQRFLDYVVFEAKGTFQDIVTRPSAFVNATLAPLYDLDPSGFGPDLTLTNLGAKRPGVFTQVGFLTVNSAFGRSSPILRGAFLQKDVLCTHFDAPPANAQTTPVPTTGKTNRENTDALTAGPDCTGCHTAYINPVGYALESYDAIGKWQTNELDTGAAIDTSATVILGDAEVNVTGPEELMAAIAASPYAQHCYASKWVQFAYQRSLTPQDACTVDAMTQRLTTGGYTVQNLITDLTQSESFRLRAPEVTQ